MHQTHHVLTNKNGLTEMNRQIRKIKTPPLLNNTQSNNTYPNNTEKTLIQEKKK